MIAWLTTSRLGRNLAALAGIALAILTFGASKKRAGRREAVEKMEQADEKRADDVRRRVDDVDGVHDDNIRYRD